MNADQFAADLRRDGYKVFYGGIRPDTVNPDHSHTFDARIMVLGGEMTIMRDGKAELFRSGDICDVPRGTVHAEHVGPDGVAVLAGHREDAR